MKVEVNYCEGKVVYDKKGATTAKNKRWKDSHVELRIYPCKKCRGWHLTSQVFMDYKSKYNDSNRNKQKSRGAY